MIAIKMQIFSLNDSTFKQGEKTADNATLWFQIYTEYPNNYLQNPMLKAVLEITISTAQPQLTWLWSFFQMTLVSWGQFQFLVVGRNRGQYAVAKQNPVTLLSDLFIFCVSKTIVFSFSSLVFQSFINQVQSFHKLVLACHWLF